MLKILTYFLIISICLIPVYSFEKEIISYSYAGNYKGWLNNPFSKGKHPVIIYNYDHFYDWAGGTVANDKGYILEEYMKTFESWGYISFIPVERYRKANAIKGAVKYLLKHENVDPTRIHIVGMGEGGFISLIILSEMQNVASLSLVTPENLNNIGYFSFPSLVRNVKLFDTPILLQISEDEQQWRIKSQLIIERLLIQENKDVLVKRYNVEKRWFFNHKHFYMNDIRRFIKNQELNNESKNTY
jgi:hypothetical protein